VTIVLSLLCNEPFDGMKRPAGISHDAGMLESPD